MILKVIIVVIILYYLILFWQLKRRRENAPSTKAESQIKERAIMGKSTFHLEQVTLLNKTDKPYYKETGDNSLFTQQDMGNDSQPMDVEFEMEFEEQVSEEELDTEDIVIETGNKSQSARGISFEEMVQAVRTVQMDELSEKEERQAVQTLAVMQQTDLYDTMIEQINGGNLRVAEMFDKYDSKFTIPDSEAIS